jgi:RHH-type proline utilization regulon transcriptional repressor/proline dehydrogenase/delta 1-pyrroline-5-carboxylate dehydrogenase
MLDLHRLENLTGFAGALWWGDEETARQIEHHLARRDGPILPMIPGLPDRTRVLAERHVCVDTTAAGGNAALLGGAA